MSSSDMTKNSKGHPIESADLSPYEKKVLRRGMDKITNKVDDDLASWAKQSLANNDAYNLGEETYILNQKGYPVWKKGRDKPESGWKKTFHGRRGEPEYEEFQPDEINTSDDVDSEEQKEVSKAVAPLVKRLVKETWFFKKRHLNYLEEMNGYSPLALENIKRIRQETGRDIKCIVDPEYVGVFAEIMGVEGHAGMAILGEYIVVKDKATFERMNFIRHEAIHCIQQSDMGGIWGAGRWGQLKWMVRSGLSFLKLKKQLSDSAEQGHLRTDKVTNIEALLSLIKKKQAPGLAGINDFAVDQELYDLETYFHQDDPNYLEQRSKFAHRKYKDPGFVQKEYQRLRGRQLQYVIEKNKKLIQEKQELLKSREVAIKESEIVWSKEDVDIADDPKIKQIDMAIQRVDTKMAKLGEQIVKMIDLADQLEGKDVVHVLAPREEIPFTERDDPYAFFREETQENRQKMLPIRTFMEKYGEEVDNYKRGAEMYIEIKEFIEFIDAMTTKQQAVDIIATEACKKIINSQTKKCGFEEGSQEQAVLINDITKLISYLINK